MPKEGKRVQIVTLKNEGKSLREIAAKTGYTKRGIQKVCENVKETESFKDRPRSGRPKLLDDRDRRNIARSLAKSDVKTAEMARSELKQYHDKDVSRDTVAH